LARKFISSAEEPLGTFSHQTSSRSVEIRPADWPEKYFSDQLTRRSSWVILSRFYTKWFSSTIERQDSREEFQKKRFDEAEEIANHNMGASNTLPSIFLTDLSKVYRKTHDAAANIAACKKLKKRFISLQRPSFLLYPKLPVISAPLQE